MRRAASWSALVVAFALSSCHGCEDRDDPAFTPHPPPSSAHEPQADIPVGTVEGVVRLADGEEPPSYATSPFDALTAGTLPPECAPSHRRDRQPLPMDDARGLGNVSVAATGDPQHWPGPGEPVIREVHIVDCRMTPETITATVGDSLRLVNELSYPFMPDLGRGVLEAVLPSDPMLVPIEQAGARQVECGFAAPCGRLQMVTFHHPVHTVTTEGGHFRIENAPADQELTINAWHPLLQAASATTRVTPGGTVHVEIVVHRVATPAPEPTPGAAPASTVAPPSTATEPASS